MPPCPAAIAEPRRHPDRPRRHLPLFPIAAAAPRPEPAFLLHDPSTVNACASGPLDGVPQVRAWWTSAPTEPLTRGSVRCCSRSAAHGLDVCWPTAWREGSQDGRCSDAPRTPRKSWIKDCHPRCAILRALELPRTSRLCGPITPSVPCSDCQLPIFLQGFRAASSLAALCLGGSSRRAPTLNFRYHSAFGGIKGDMRVVC